ncbi:MAG: carboxymuconolactone decarboxylase family protein [Ktedonobacteraceae bacterium]|nr:carboxymuconolactone decarboxylase family protein [Ktedonobacteraceae bacterium]
MTITMKSIDDVRTSALIMLTAKAAEGCSSCLEGYKRAAEKAGATQGEINFAIAAGMRAKATNELSNSDDETVQQKAQAILLHGNDKENFLQQVTTNTDVRVLDRFFHAQGYKLVEAAREVAQYEMGDRTCTGAYLPYVLDDNKDRFAWIGYNVGQRGEDIVGVVADLSTLKSISGPTTVLAPEQFIQASYIVENGAVVPGHACDTNCFWNNLWPTCGGCLVGCLMSGPGWIACTVTCCGGNATVWCFWCGCC